MTDSRQINIVLLGAPGAGKGTQALHLIKAYNLLHVSTGDMLRATVKGETELGKEIQEFMDRGELVPNEIVTKSVIERISKPDAAEGVILDGYPRNKVQAETLDNALNEAGRALTVVLYMKVSEDIVIARLSGRRVCPKCGYNYHLTNIPPKNTGICDSCSVNLIQRKDDNIGTIKNRFKVYEESTKDLIDYYAGKGLLREVDGGSKAEELFKTIDCLFKEEGLLNDNSEK